jgi:predicted peptidase
MKAILSVLLVLGFCVGCSSSPASKVNAAAPKGAGFSVQESTLADGSMRKYGLFVPFNYDAKRPTPAIVFLHGRLEASGDGVKCTSVGIGPAIGREPTRWSAVVIFPVSPGGSWSSSLDHHGVIAALDATRKKYNIDPKRVALTGLSTGGSGVWRVAAAFPDRFSRLAPMAGYSASDVVDKLPKVPVWAGHNTTDPFVLYGDSKGMVAKINERGGNAKLTAWGGGGLNPHDCWSRAYSDEEFVRWIQQ